MSDKTTVHLMRHGEVDNPQGILYGRRDGFHLTARGREMAQVVADSIAHRTRCLTSAASRCAFSACKASRPWVTVPL